MARTTKCTDGMINTFKGEIALAVIARNSRSDVIGTTMLRAMGGWRNAGGLRIWKLLPRMNGLRQAARTMHSEMDSEI